MKEDIDFPEVKGVSVAIAREDGKEGGAPTWKAYLLNTNDFPIVNVIVASKGYGHQNGASQKTSVLRHLFDRVEAHASVPIELVDEAVFHLVNEYWVSYYKDEPGSDIFDKKFLFLPDSIVPANMRHIRQLDLEGVLHG